MRVAFISKSFFASSVGYIEGQGPCKIKVLFIFVTPRKTDIFVIALVIVE